jgi:hypothetical protein
MYVNEVKQDFKKMLKSIYNNLSELNHSSDKYLSRLQADLFPETENRYY